MPKDLIAIRDQGNRSAIIFLHGFSGKGETTWGDFPEFLKLDKGLTGWDIYSVQYETHLFFSRAIFWQALPPISRIANSFHTDCLEGRLAEYENLCIIAHSMGGLVAQKALVIDEVLPNKVSHLIMFGTPSKGLQKAGRFWWWSRQIEDMAKDSKFLISLRDSWQACYEKYPFKTVAIAGTMDEFVPEESCHFPFEDKLCKFIEGNHLQIVKPRDARDKSVQLVINILKGESAASDLVDAACLAIEKRDFHRAVKVYENYADKLDENSLVHYALALCSEEKPDVAIEALIRYGQKKKRTDAMGTLAGRYKRLWLQSGIEEFYRLSEGLYTDAYYLSEGDPDQSYYHAINIAYLNLAQGQGKTVSLERAIPWADKAVQHSMKAKESYWQQATIAEGLLIQGELAKAIEKYIRALSFQPSPREIESTFLQAMDIMRYCYPREEEIQMVADSFRQKFD